MKLIRASSDICSELSTLMALDWKGANALKAQVLDAIKRAFGIAGIEFIDAAECRVELLFKSRVFEALLARQDDTFLLKLLLS